MDNRGPFVGDVVATVTHPDRELTPEERLHLGLDEGVAATVVHPDRELTPAERAHLGLDNEEQE